MVFEFLTDLFNRIIGRSQPTQQPLLDLGADFETERQLSSTETIRARFEFVTRRDPLVDPNICEPLDGTIWYGDDPNIPVPIKDTHLHCRCQLVLLEE